MKKYIVTSILSIALATTAAYADSSKLMMKSGIGLNESNSYNQQQEQNTDPIKWKDETRLSKNPPKNEQPKTEEGKCFYVTSAVTNIRSTPSFLADRIGIYKYGNYICEKSRIGDWINTGSGWVNIKFLSEKAPDTKIAARQQEAKPQETVKKQPAPVVVAAAPVKQETAAPAEQTQQVASPLLKKRLTAKQQQQQKTDTSKDTQTQKQTVSYINASKVNIRKSPSKRSKIIGLYDVNQKVTVLDTQGDWSKTKKGWVNNKFISDSKDGSSKNSKQAKADKVIKCMYVSYDKANIRTDPSKRSKDIGDYNKGEMVCFYELQKNWGRTDKGWVNLANLSEAKCYEVVSSTLKVMSKPSATSKVVKILKKGDQVCDFGRKYDWVNNGKGWVSSIFLR